MRLVALLLIPLALSGCGAVTAVQLASKGTEVAEIRIGRITTYNNAKLERCLALVRELDRVALKELDNAQTPDEIKQAIHIANISTMQMERCRPELLIERLKDIRDGQKTG